MNLAEKKIGSQLIYGGKVVRLEVDRVVLPDGSEAERECVRHSGGAAVLFVREGKIAFVRQFRYLYGKEIYEIPAGKLNAGEDPAVCAARELEEETGYRATSLTHLCNIYPTPGYTDEIINLYYTEEARYVGQNLDKDEFLNCVFLPVEEVEKLIEEGAINDAKTLVAFYRAFSARK